MRVKGGIDSTAGFANILTPHLATTTIVGCGRRTALTRTPAPPNPIDCAMGAAPTPVQAGFVWLRRLTDGKLVLLVHERRGTSAHVLDRALVKGGEG